MKVKLISKTALDKNYLLELMKEASEEDKKFLATIQDSEALIAYTARVSSANQKNPQYKKLLKYCMEHGHWSIFEMVDATVEIETTLPIATQILRHRSFSFQQLSRRYSSDGVEFEEIKPRRQDTKNRQNSINDLHDSDKLFFKQAQESINQVSEVYYNQAISRGIAKESARFLLPQTTTTKLYMKGSLRSFIHYLKVRNNDSTQKEHREIAQLVQKELKKAFPLIGEICEW